MWYVCVVEVNTIKYNLASYLFVLFYWSMFHLTQIQTEYDEHMTIWKYECDVFFSFTKWLIISVKLFVFISLLVLF